MSLMDMVQDEEKIEDTTIQGVALAEVTNNKDPRKWGRVKVKYPWRENSPESDWARVAALAGGKDRGTLWLPEVGDEVLVAFDKGDIDHPFVLGGLWNGVDVPPETNDDGQNDTKLIRTRSGHDIRFFDKPGQESITIQTQGGHSLFMDDTAGGALIELRDSSGQNMITIDTVANSITIESALSLRIRSQTIDIEAGASMNIKATGTISIQGALVRIN
jgi:uncharacterized protein involved in type VI secretion and phage assembly